MCRSAGGIDLSGVKAQPEKTSHLLSLAKAFSWRIVATLTTAIVAFAITGEVDTALLIGGIEFFLKIGIYYLHERIWLMLT